jgi:hypothetical protein
VWLSPRKRLRKHQRYDARSYGNTRNGNPHPNANPYLARPAAPHDFHRRYNERTYEANVTSVRAVVGPP